MILTLNRWLNSVKFSEYYISIRNNVCNEHQNLIETQFSVRSDNINCIFNLSVWSLVRVLVSDSSFLVPFYFFAVTNDYVFFKTTQNIIFAHFWLFLMVENNTYGVKLFLWLHSHQYQSYRRACIYIQYKLCSYVCSPIIKLYN